MANEPGAVAKAFLDALPALDFKKLVSEARRQLPIVIAGDELAADQLLQNLSGDATVPSDSRLTVRKHIPGAAAPADAGKPELVIVVPATEERIKQARESFSGVPLLPVEVPVEAGDLHTSGAVVLRSLELDDVKRVLVPRLVEQLWERRLALGRGMPITRDHVCWRLTQAAARDVRVLLGSVAGASGGRSGAPTPATAQLLMHQGALIVSIAAVSGAQLDDKVEIFRRVAPNLVPTLLLDGAEAGVSKLASGSGKGKHATLYGHLAAYLTRPALSISSTFLAGLIARRVFRTGDRPESKPILVRTRDLGRRAAVGAGQSAAMAVGVVGARLRMRGSPKDQPPGADELIKADGSSAETPDEHGAGPSNDA